MSEKKKTSNKSKTDLYNTMFAQDAEDIPEVDPALISKNDAKQKPEPKDLTQENPKHKQKHEQEAIIEQLPRADITEHDDGIRIQYHVSRPEPTEIDNTEYEWALRIKQGAKQKPKLEDIAERRTYWIYNDNLKRIEEITAHSGLDKYEVVNMAIQQLYKWMKSEQQY